MAYTTRQTCRLCEGQFESVLNLGEIYLSTFFEEGDDNMPKAPIDFVRCRDCGLYQLRDTVNQDFLYSTYWYQSGLNQSMRDALANVVKETLKRVTLKDHDIVIDIGANDGTLLKNYPKSVIRVAYEPSNIGNQIQSDSADIVFSDYFDAEHYRRIFTEKAKIITAIAMFYDLEDPSAFLRDIKAILHEEGVFVIQMMDLMSMFKTGDFPNLCHEHICYYSLEILDSLLLSHDLEIFDLEYNKVNGGSLRVYVRHDSKTENPEVIQRALREEAAFFKEYTPEMFRYRVESVRDKITQFIRTSKSLGYMTAILGASTKGNTMLQYFGLTDKDIDHAAEVNPDKYGKRTVGSNIPIISEEVSTSRHPDYYLILPWGFTSFFVERFKAHLEKGNWLISPLPEPRIIYMDRDGSLREDLL